jgi:hypothetical protein
MRLSLSLSMVLALMIASLAACEIHAEAGHQANSPPPPPPPPAAATPTTPHSGGHHLTVSDAGA